MNRPDQTEKVLLRTDSKAVSEAIQSNVNAASAVNMMMDYFKASELEIPSLPFLRRLIESELSDEVIHEYVDKLYIAQPKRIREQLREEIYNDISTFFIGRTLRDYEFVEIKKGKAQVMETAQKTITDRYSVFIETPEQIDRYNRLQTLVAGINQLGSELKEANIVAGFSPINLIQPTNDGNWTIDWRLNF